MFYRVYHKNGDCFITESVLDTPDMVASELTLGGGLSQLWRFSVTEGWVLAWDHIADAPMRVVA